MKARQIGIGHLPLVKVERDAQGQLGDAAIVRLTASLNSVITLLNGKLRIGDGTANSQTGNLDGMCVRVANFPSTPDTEVTIPHSLGRPPIAAIPIFKDRACDVYSLRGAAEAWGDNNLAYFACDTASAKVILLLL